MKMPTMTIGALVTAVVVLTLVAPAPAAAQQATGDVVFKQRCAACHAVGGKGGKVGPDLTGIIGRKAGSGAYSYSTAMRNSKTVWDRGSLDAYLAAPTKTVPGTKMAVALTRREDRAAVITFLSRTR